MGQDVDLVYICKYYKIVFDRSKDNDIGIYLYKRNTNYRYWAGGSLNCTLSFLDQLHFVFRII